MSNFARVLAVTVNGESIDDVVSMTVTQGVAIDPVKDQLGSVHAWVNANTGAVEQKQSYTAYGETTITQSSPLLTGLGMQRAFTGREFDLDTELQHNRARWYNPKTGRWLSPDPIGFKAGDSNLFRYVTNGPTIYTDPSGQYAVAIIWIFKQIIGYPIKKFCNSNPIAKEEDEVKKMYKEEKLRREREREKCGVNMSCEQPKDNPLPGPA